MRAESDSAPGVGGVPGVHVTGPYWIAGIRDAPRAAWIASRAFGSTNTSSPPSSRAALMWALARYPATLCEHALLITTYRTYMTGHAVVSLIIPRAGLHSRQRAALQFLGMLLAMALGAAILLAVTIYSGNTRPLGWAQYTLGLVAVLFLPSLAVRLVADRRTGQARGGRPPGARLELTALAAWPRGRGHGLALFDAVITDIAPALGPGECVILEARSERLAELYATRGFTGTSGSPWMRLR